MNPLPVFRRVKLPFTNVTIYDANLPRVSLRISKSGRRWRLLVAAPEEYLFKQHKYLYHYPSKKALIEYINEVIKTSGCTLISLTADIVRGWNRDLKSN